MRIVRPCSSSGASTTGQPGPGRACSWSARWQPGTPRAPAQTSSTSPTPLSTGASRTGCCSPSSAGTCSARRSSSPRPPAPSAAPRAIPPRGNRPWSGEILRRSRSRIWPRAGARRGSHGPCWRCGMRCSPSTSRPSSCSVALSSPPCRRGRRRPSTVSGWHRPGRR